MCDCEFLIRKTFSIVWSDVDHFFMLGRFILDLIGFIHFLWKLMVV